jgi:quercetin dioxygenase-like cupin family protein
MEKSGVEVARWSEEHTPTEGELKRLLAAEGLSFYHWSNGPKDVYSAHSHGYHKVIYVVNGSISFGLPDSGEQVTLHPGDRLELPAGVTHNAVVGLRGVSCLEAHRD